MCEIQEPDDYCTIWKQYTVTARKRHKCSSCGSAIRPGEKYMQHKSLFDGSWDMEKMCRPCEAASDEFGEAHDGATFSPSGFVDALNDCISEEDEESGRWAPMQEAMRARRALEEG